MNPKTPITQAQYDALIADKYTPEEIEADGLVLAPTNTAPRREEFNPARQPDFARKALQNVPLVGPWLDEAEGAAQGLGGYLADKLRGRKTSLSQRVSESQGDMRASIDATRKLQGGAGVLGDIALSIAGGSAMLKGGSALAGKLAGGDLVAPAKGVMNYVTRNAARVASGAGAGAVMGAGAADPGKRVQGGMGGAVVGGGMSALPAMIEAGQAGVRQAKSFATQRGPTARAGSELAATMKADGLMGQRARGTFGQPGFVPATPSAIARPPEYPGQTVADVAANVPSGGYTDQLLRESVAIPGEAGGAIKRNMATRAGGRAGRIDDALTTGSSFAAERPEVVKKTVDATTRPNIQSAYKAALGRPKKSIESDELRSILEADDPFVKKAMSYAQQKMRANRIPGAQKPVVTDGPDVVMWGKADYNAPMIDYTKRGLDAQISTFIKQGNIADARAAMITRGRLVKEADKLIPGYKEARAADEGRRALNSAMDLGRKLGKGNIDVREAEDMVARLTPESPDFATPDEVQTMFRRGVADGMRRRLGKARDGAGAIRAIVGSDNAKEVTRLAFPDDASFQTFEKTLMSEARQIPGEAMVGGSRVNPQFLSHDALGAASPWSLKQAVTGDPALFAAQLAGTLTGQAKKRSGEKVARELAGVAGEAVGGARARITDRAIRQQAAIPRWAERTGARNRASAANVNPALQRLFQTFMIQNGNKDGQ